MHVDLCVCVDLLLSLHCQEFCRQASASHDKHWPWPWSLRFWPCNPASSPWIARPELKDLVKDWFFASRVLLFNNYLYKFPIEDNFIMFHMSRNEIRWHADILRIILVYYDTLGFDPQAKFIGLGFGVQALALSSCHPRPWPCGQVSVAAKRTMTDKTRRINGLELGT